MGKRGFFRSLLLASCLGVFGAGANAAPFTINDALRMAVQTNPSVGEAAANKRATEAELRQVQSTLLPQVRLEASTGPEQTQQPGNLSAQQRRPYTQHRSVRCRRAGLDLRPSIVVRWFHVIARDLAQRGARRRCRCAHA